ERVFISPLLNPAFSLNEEIGRCQHYVDRYQSKPHHYREWVQPIQGPSGKLVSPHRNSCQKPSQCESLRKNSCQAAKEEGPIPGFFQGSFGPELESHSPENEAE